MKTAFMTFAMMGLATIVLSGCTTSTAMINSRSTKEIYTTEKTVYSKEELDKRGRQTPAAALAAQDPSITVSGR